jgi:hypothetical protein
MKNNNKKLFFLELNEFNYEFLKQKSLELNLPYVKKIFDLNHKQFKCDKLIEHFGLDPWTQWVNIHTGKKSDDHGLLQIGQSNDLKYKQFWDHLSDQGVKSGIWGSMNIKNFESKNNLFFFPDPWNFHEKIKPFYLNLFFSLPKYLFKNFLALNIFKLLYNFTLFIIYLLFSGKIFILMYKFFKIAKLLLGKSINKYYFYPIFDWINTIIFLSYKKKFNLDLSVLFINLVATLQHRIWDDETRKDENNFSLYILDNILKEIFMSLEKDEKILISNGLSQEKLGHEHFHYRQIDPSKFFQTFGINNFTIEQNMTNDGFLFFNNKNSFNEAFSIIKNLKINEHNLMYCEEIIKKEGYCIFYMINYEDKISNKTKISLFNKSYIAISLITLDAIRTGRHIPITDCLGNFSFNDKSEYNFKIFNYVNNYFN